MATELKVVMFTDQVKFTENTAERVPAEIKQVARAQDELTAEVTKQYRGRILKDTGDGHLIEFLSCADAVRCGFVLQERLRARNEAQTNARLKCDLHVGIDLGELVILPNGDVRGEAANRCARVCSQCPPSAVYVTEKVRNEIHGREAQFSEIGSLELKGVEGKVTIHCLSEWLGPTESAPNPFIWRSGITKAEDFFDRDNEQRTLRAYLGGRQNCQIVGPRRIGKTSLLRQVQRIAREWDEAAVVVYLDLQDPRCFTLSGWLDHARREFGWTRPVKTPPQFSALVDGMLSKGQHPVLCLDEFEELTMRRSEFVRDFFLMLRSSGQRGMSIVTVSQKPLSELTDPGDPTSPFYNTFPIVPVAGFSNHDAEDFVTLYRAGVPPFTPEEKKQILNFAKGHPLALQVGCFHLLEAKARGESLDVAIERAVGDMKAALPTPW